MNQSLSHLLQLVCNPESKIHYLAVDVGAHYGEYSKFLISTGLFSKVVSFEPNPESHLKLLNAVFPTADCEYAAINSALSSKSGMLDLYCDEDMATASLLRYESCYLNQGAINKRAVPVLTLDEYLFENSVDVRLLLLKIDTQGNDLSVIKGAGRAISEHRPIIQTEFIYINLYEGQCSPAELTEVLSQLGYKMYSLNNLHVTPEGRLAFCDAIFIPEELDVLVTQKYSCIDDQISFQSQIETLMNICAERLTVIVDLKQACDERLELIHKLTKSRQ